MSIEIYKDKNTEGEKSGRENGKEKDPFYERIEREGLMSKSLKELLEIGISNKDRGKIIEIKSREIEMEKEKLFNPPEKLLKLIRDESIRREEMILSTFSFDKEEYEYVVKRIDGEIKKFFGDRFIEDYKKQIILMAIFEALMNAGQHGNKGDPSKKVRMGFWFSPKGVLLGFRDEGDFYKQPSTKKLVESRTVLKSTKEIPSGMGMEGIYEADEIYVSTKENTLYLFVSLPGANKLNN